MVQHWKIRLSLGLNVVVFAILLNTVGIVIKRVIDDYSVNEATELVGRCGSASEPT